MTQQKTVFQTAFYTVAFTGVLMLPTAAVLWWAGGYAASELGTDGGDFQHPGTYLRYAAAALAAIGSVLTIGAVAFAKKAAIGKYMLGAGCCAVVVLSLWPVSDLVMVSPKWWIGVAAIVGWMVFSAPYTALFLMLRKQ